MSEKSVTLFISSPIKSIPTTYGLLANALIIAGHSFNCSSVNKVLLAAAKYLIETPVSSSIFGITSCI